MAAFFLSMVISGFISTADAKHGWELISKHEISEAILKHNGMIDLCENNLGSMDEFQLLTTSLDRYQILEGLRSIDTKGTVELFEIVAEAEDYFYSKDEATILRDRQTYADAQKQDLQRFQYAYEQKILSTPIELPNVKKVTDAVFRRNDIEKIFEYLADLMGAQLEEVRTNAEFVDIFGTETRKQRLIKIVEKVRGLSHYSTRYKRLMWSLRNRNSIYSEYLNEAKVAGIGKSDPAILQAYFHMMEYIDLRATVGLIEVNLESIIRELRNSGLNNASTYFETFRMELSAIEKILEDYERKFIYSGLPLASINTSTLESDLLGLKIMLEERADKLRERLPAKLRKRWKGTDILDFLLRDTTFNSFTDPSLYSFQDAAAEELEHYFKKSATDSPTEISPLDGPGDSSINTSSGIAGGAGDGEPVADTIVAYEMSPFLDVAADEGLKSTTEGLAGLDVDGSSLTDLGSDATEILENIDCDAAADVGAEVLGCVVENSGEALNVLTDIVGPAVEVLIGLFFDN